MPLGPKKLWKVLGMATRASCDERHALKTVAAVTTLGSSSYFFLPDDVLVWPM